MSEDLLIYVQRQLAREERNCAGQPQAIEPLALAAHPLVAGIDQVRDPQLLKIQYWLPYRIGKPPSYCIVTSIFTGCKTHHSIPRVHRISHFGYTVIPFHYIKPIVSILRAIHDHVRIIHEVTFSRIVSCITFGCNIVRTRALSEVVPVRYRGCLGCKWTVLLAKCHPLVGMLSGLTSGTVHEDKQRTQLTSQSERGREVIENSLGMYASIMGDIGKDLAEDAELKAAITAWANGLTAAIKRFDELGPEDRMVLSLLALAAESSKEGFALGIKSMMQAMLMRGFTRGNN